MSIIIALRKWIARSGAAILSALLMLDFGSGNGVGGDGQLALWTMIHVNPPSQQGDAHLLQYANGENDLIDAGHHSQGGTLVKFLLDKNIHQIDILWISHAHSDHYGGIEALIKAGITIREARFHYPDKGVCDEERGWGCDYADFSHAINLLGASGTRLHPVRAGEILSRGEGVTMEVRYAYDGINSPVGKTDINDTSLILLLGTGYVRTLFTGDLNSALGEWLTMKGLDIQADILKVPHHGTESLAPNAFFKRVAPKAVLVPSPQVLWRSDRSRRAREYFEQSGIPTYVNGEHGHVAVSLHPRRFEIQPQFGTGTVH